MRVRSACSSRSASARCDASFSAQASASDSRDCVSSNCAFSSSASHTACARASSPQLLRPDGVHRSPVQEEGAVLWQFLTSVFHSSMADYSQFNKHTTVEWRVGKN